MTLVPHDYHKHRRSFSNAIPDIQSCMHVVGQEMLYVLMLEFCSVCVYVCAVCVHVCVQLCVRLIQEVRELGCIFVALCNCLCLYP